MLSSAASAVHSEGVEQHFIGVTDVLPDLKSDTSNCALLRKLQVSDVGQYCCTPSSGCNRAFYDMHCLSYC